MIYCKDCKNYFDCGFCSLYNDKRDKDEYCSRGEEIKQVVKLKSLSNEFLRDLILENEDESR